MRPLSKTEDNTAANELHVLHAEDFHAQFLDKQRLYHRQPSVNSVYLYLLSGDSDTPYNKIEIFPSRETEIYTKKLFYQKRLTLSRK